MSKSSFELHTTDCDYHGFRPCTCDPVRRIARRQPVAPGKSLLSEGTDHECITLLRYLERRFGNDPRGWYSLLETTLAVVDRHLEQPDE